MTEEPFDLHLCGRSGEPDEELHRLESLLAHYHDQVRQLPEDEPEIDAGTESDG